jgi:hypothetical protein
VGRTEAIELQQGCSRRIRAAHRAVSLLAICAILTSAAPVTARAAFLGALLAVHLAAARHMRRTARAVPRVRLFEDGTAALLLERGAVSAVLAGPGWTSHWLSVFPLRRLDGGRRVYCTICRSSNGDDAYRRLRVLLRLRGEPAVDGQRGWL